MKEFPKTNLKKMSYKKLSGLPDEKYKEFFLALGLMFNDLNDIQWMSNQLEDYRIPIDKTERSSHFGRYNALNLFFARTFLSIINEIIIFFEKEKTKEITNSKYMKEFINSNYILKSERAQISSFLNDGLGKKVSNKQRRFLRKLRGNMSSHYPYDYKGVLSDGFNTFFNSKNPDIYFDSILETRKSQDVLDSRIYYVDASIQGFLEKDSAEYVEKFKSLSVEIVFALALILDGFHRDIKK